MASSGTRIPKRISTALISSLGSGVVPRVGLEHVAVGRKPELNVLVQDLENVSDGASFCKFIVGRYGSGKSFFLKLVRNYSLDRNFAVADADLSPERRLSGKSGQGRATYRELIHNLSTKIRPDGGAFEAALERWISGIQAEVVTETSVKPDAAEFGDLVERKIFEVVRQMEGMVHGFDFARVVTFYWRGHRLNDLTTKSNALRWFLGEYSTKTEARAALGVSVIIDDDNWYDYIKLFASFLTKLGYRGLIILIDEAVNLYKISHPVSRNTNYEKILSIYNDALQGKAEHLGILFGGTPQFIEDSRRGLFSYDALRSRLSDSRFKSDSWKSYSGPVLRLETLTHEEIFVLLSRLLEIHELHHGWKSNISQTDVQDFMQQMVDRMGAEALLTPREMVKDFLELLSIIRENPGTKMSEIVHGPNFHPAKPGLDPDSTVSDEFEEFVL